MDSDVSSLHCFVIVVIHRAIAIDIEVDLDRAVELDRWSIVPECRVVLLGQEHEEVSTARILFAC